MGLSFRDKACDMLCLDMIDMLDLDVVLLQIPIKTPSGSDPFRLRLVATAGIDGRVDQRFFKSPAHCILQNGHANIPARRG